MGCVQSVEDKAAAGTWQAGGQGARSGHWQAEAAGAVAEMLGSSTSAQIEIAIKCRGLPNKDVFSKSDPMAVLLTGDPHGRAWSEAGRTDVVANSLNPEFRTPLIVTYIFEQLQPMRIAIYDVDVRSDEVKTLKLGQQDFLGEGSFLLSDLLTAPGQALTVQLLDANRRPLPGCVALLTAEELPLTNAVVHLSLAASKLDNKDTFGKSDPFVRISKSREGGAWVPVLKTEVINNNLNPTWKPFQASMTQFCNCDPQRPLLIEVFDHDTIGSHDLIGACQTNMASIQNAAASGQGLDLINPQKMNKAGYINSGTLLVKNATVVPRPSFLDYIKEGGVTLNFLVAVDFTASNRDPSDPASLHFMGQRTTQYEDAISAVGQVLEHYDTDKMFPCWGFGASLPPTGTTSHCFALNGNPSDPEVAGVAGILQAYRQTLTSVRLSGPTLFAPIITAASQMAAQPASHPQYFVLLILTDGCIMDMNNTLSALVSASGLPLSLLIVGVGNDDFAAMEFLDADDHKLRAPDGRMAQRDCVQFVPFRPQQRDTVEGLASKLLAELPGQLVEYFHDMKRMPPPPKRKAPPPPAFSNDEGQGSAPASAGAGSSVPPITVAHIATGVPIGGGGKQAY